MWALREVRLCLVGAVLAAAPGGDVAVRAPPGDAVRSFRRNATRDKPAAVAGSQALMLKAGGGRGAPPPRFSGARRQFLIV